MKQRFRLYRRNGGIYYVHDDETGKQESLQTRDRAEASALFAAKTQAHRQAHLNLRLARTYLAATDPMVAKRTWQVPMDELGKTKRGPTLVRWQRAIRDKAFDLIRDLPILETQAEHFLKVLYVGTVSTNVFLRRIHNFALDMGWLPWPVVVKRQWPAIEFKDKRAITWEEHCQIIGREKNPERKAFYQMAWHTGASQSDLAFLEAENVDLVDTSPDKALPIILTGTQSAQPDRRRWCFRLLSEYSSTPEIQSAMEHGVNDPDPIISQNAKYFLTEQYRKAHPIESQFLNEPAFQGKGLGEWVKMRRDPDGSLPDDAVAAIHHMGTNAIPGLLVRLVYREPPFGLRSRVDGAVHVQAMCAFIVLGEQAIPALPQLRTLMDGTNGDIAVRAMMATCGTGTNAIPFFINGLTSQFADVRNEAANYISQNFTNQFLGQRDQLAPLFVKLLDDPDEFVRMNATNELKQIAPEAAGKAGIK